MTIETLLPENADVYERALAAGMSDALPVPLRQILDPAIAPEDWIPFLAVHEGIRLWFGDWSSDRKRQMVREWPELANLIGVRPGLRRMLAYVDADLVSVVAHPRRFIAGRSAAGIQPIQFPDYTARYLIRVGLRRHRSGMVAGRGSAGQRAAVPVDLEPIRRSRTAAVAAKIPGTQYTATFAHRRRPTFDQMAFGMPFDAFIDRVSL